MALSFAMSTEPTNSPLHELHEQREAFFLPYGDESGVSMVVETFGDLDMEYAALRKGCVIFDENHMGTLEISGSERLAFLNNMLTAKVDDLKPGTSCWSFWLNRKGRIDADLRVSESRDRMLVRVDRHLARKTAESLDAFLFSEDVEIKDVSERVHRIAVHGPTANQLIAKAFDIDLELDPLRNLTTDWNEHPVLIERDDLCGEPGFCLCVEQKQATSLYKHLLNIADSNSILTSAIRTFPSNRGLSTNECISRRDATSGKRLWLACMRGVPVHEQW